jgi:hypothetical protein
VANQIDGARHRIAALYSIGFALLLGALLNGLCGLIDFLFNRVFGLFCSVNLLFLDRSTGGGRGRDIGAATREQGDLNGNKQNFHDDLLSYDQKA